MFWLLLLVMMCVAEVGNKNSCSGDYDGGVAPDADELLQTS